MRSTETFEAVQVRDGRCWCRFDYSRLGDIYKYMLFGAKWDLVGVYLFAFEMKCPFLKALAQALVYEDFNLLHRKRDSTWPRPDDAHAS